MEHIIKVQKNFQGDIISFQTSEGRIISYLKAIQEAGDGILDGTSIELDQNGSAYLTNHDEEDKDFSNLPPIF